MGAKTLYSRLTREDEMAEEFALELIQRVSERYGRNGGIVELPVQRIVLYDVNFQLGSIYAEKIAQQLSMERNKIASRKNGNSNGDEAIRYETAKALCCIPIEVEEDLAIGNSDIENPVYGIDLGYFLSRPMGRSQATL